MFGMFGSMIALELRTHLTLFVGSNDGLVELSKTWGRLGSKTIVII